MNQALLLDELSDMHLEIVNETSYFPTLHVIVSYVVSCRSGTSVTKNESWHALPWGDIILVKAEVFSPCAT